MHRFVEMYRDARAMCVRACFSHTNVACSGFYNAVNEDRVTGKKGKHTPVDSPAEQKLRVAMRDAISTLHGENSSGILDCLTGFRRVMVEEIKRSAESTVNQVVREEDIKTPEGAKKAYELLSPRLQSLHLAVLHPSMDGVETQLALRTKPLRYDHHTWLELELLGVDRKMFAPATVPAEGELRLVDAPILPPLKRLSFGR